MSGMVLANEQICIAFLDRHGVKASIKSRNWFCLCGFPKSRLLNSRFVRNSKNLKLERALGLGKARVGSINALLKENADGEPFGVGILEKESEFKPSFDEYLKAMESVRSFREKRSSHNLSEHGSTGNDHSAAPSVGRDEPSANGKRRDGYSSKQNASIVGKDGLSRNISEKKRLKLDDRASLEKDDVQRRVQGGINGMKKQTLHKDSKPYHGSGGLKAPDANVGAGTTRPNDCKISRRENSSRMSGFDDDTNAGWKDGVGTSVRLTKSSKASNRKDNYGNFEVERAAFKYFDESGDVVSKPKSSRMEMEERIQKLAKWLNGADIDMPEWMFSKIMRSAKIKFCDHSIMRLIQILGKLGNWRRALQVIEWLQMREHFKSNKPRYIYTSALDVLGKARRPVEALNLFHMMLNQMSTYPDLVAYHSIAVTLGQAGHMKELFDVIDTMRSPPKKKLKTSSLVKWDLRLEPDITIYNAVLNACVKQEQWEGAFWVLQQLKQEGQQPSPTTYGLVMEVMLACGKYNLVHEFFRKVQKSCIPNALIFKVMVNALWREGKTDEAVMVVQEMEKRGIVGSAALYYDLACCLCGAGRCQEALMLVEKICKVANKPLVVTYTGLINACLKARDIESGSFVFEQMEKYCSPNLVTCNIMLKAYLEHGMFEEAKQLFNQMLENCNHVVSKSDYTLRVIPDIYTFNTMLDACFEGKRWEDLEYVYQKMLFHGYHFNEKRHLPIVLDSSRAGKFGMLEITWNHLIEADRPPPIPLVKERFCAMLGKDDCHSALSCLGQYLEGEPHGFSRVAWFKLFKHNAHRFRRESVERLARDAALLLASSKSPNVGLQTLLTSCKEFFGTT